MSACKEPLCICDLTDEAIRQAEREYQIEHPEPLYKTLLWAFSWAVVFGECLIIYGVRGMTLGQIVKWWVG